MHLTLLLPAFSRLRDAPLSPLAALMLGRGERLPDAPPGRQAQLRRYFDLPENQWPLAALTRQDDVGDAGDALWLRADPCHIRPDINGARLLAVGRTLLQDDEDDEAARALQPALQAVFAEAGFDFEMLAHGGWYLKLPDGTPPPETLPPAEALGLDLVDHHIITATGGGRRWRALLSEAEIALHHHPYNAERIKTGKLPINSLWFWGGGVLPERVGTTVSELYSDDETAWALAAAAGVRRVLPLLAASDAFARRRTATFDLTYLRSMSEFNTRWLAPVMHALTSSEIARVHLDTEDGQRWNLRPAHRWRIWRTPWNPPA